MASNVPAAPLQPLPYGSFLLAASPTTLLQQDLDDLLKDVLNAIKIKVLAGGGRYADPRRVRRFRRTDLQPRCLLRVNGPASRAATVPMALDCGDGSHLSMGNCDWVADAPGDQWCATISKSAVVIDVIGQAAISVSAKKPDSRLRAVGSSFARLTHICELTAEVARFRGSGAWRGVKLTVPVQRSSTQSVSLDPATSAIDFEQHRVCQHCVSRGLQLQQRCGETRSLLRVECRFGSSYRPCNKLYLFPCNASLMPLLVAVDREVVRRVLQAQAPVA